MKLLLTTIIGLPLAVCAIGGGPDARMIAFRSDLGKPCTFTFEADGKGLIHAILITNGKEIGITFEDLFFHDPYLEGQRQALLNATALIRIAI